MCGISGMFDMQGSREFSRDLLQRINDIQQHRGPDAAGLHLEPGVALGHRRLSVIDLATGQQPLFNEDGSVCVVFNGEIYNFKDLVPELQKLGHTFKTRSDTEVIVHAWEAWGEDCVQRFRGMFAFALWDRHKQTLFLARDRMGVKPLHYAVLADGTFIFGSELKVITAHPAFQRNIDPLAVEDYFALGYVAEPRCIFRGARKLMPGHTLTLKRGKATLEPRQYWDVRFSGDSNLGPERAIAELRPRVDEAVKLRMVADVPLGAFLSGGVDSSAVVASMAKLSDSPVETCAIGFDDKNFDESAYAARVAEQYGTKHHLDIVGGGDLNVLELIDKLAWLYDEPYADSSALPTYRVCQLARRHVTVAISGDGGDETFGGYRRYRLHMAEEGARRSLPLGMRRALFGTLGAIYPKADWAPRVFRAKTTFQALALDSVAAYFHSMSILRDAERRRLYSPEFKRTLAGYTSLEVFRRYARAADRADPLGTIQYIDYKTWLTGDINTKVDRASMAHSLEVREPLMDHKLVEWMAALPSDYKLHAGQGKWIFKKAFENALPNDLLYRPKMGFSVPLAAWLRGPLAQRLQDSVLGPRLLDTGYFDQKTIAKMVKLHQRGQRDFSAPLWSLLMFDAFLANAGASAPPAAL
jgi:asparagine synthase (glutamine-hydrolysing)